MHRYCLQCGRLIPEPSAGKKYCSDECRRAARSAYQIRWARAHYSTEKGRAETAKKRSTPEGAAQYQRKLAEMAAAQAARNHSLTPEERESRNTERRKKYRLHMAELRKPHRYTRALDLSGQRFGRLTAVERTNKRKGSSYLWRCQCDCGRSCTVTAYMLTSGNVRSCGCLQDESRRTDITGQKRGHLTAIKPTNHRRGNDTVWEWRCDCGAIIYKTPELVREGMSTMCPSCARELRRQHAALAQEQRDTETGMMPGALENLRSGKPFKNNTSGVRGVSWHNGTGKWAARISENGKTRTIGYYDTIDEAAAARQNAVLIKYGPPKQK